MQQPAIEFKKIYEHDMDLLIIEEFVADRGFAQLFLNKLNLPDNYTIHHVAHSLADADGESDITLILQYPDKKVAVLIEDKIDAPTMPEQSERYRKRAESAIMRGEYDYYYVMLAAPSAYHEEHINDNNAAYAYRISYEELREYLSKQTSPHAWVKTAMIDHAIKEKKAGYLVQEVKSVTAFWNNLRKHCKETYPNLILVGEEAPKGASACWPEFRTSLGTIKVIYKSQYGYVDLEFPKYGDRIGDLTAVIKNRQPEGAQIWKTGKSASLRLKNDKWIISFTHDFDASKTIIDEVLQAVSVLCEFATTLNYSELY